MDDRHTEQNIRIEALRFATDGVGKTRFNPDLVIATAVKYANYITDGTIPEPQPVPPAAPQTATPAVGRVQRGRPRKKVTGEGE